MQAVIVMTNCSPLAGMCTATMIEMIEILLLPRFGKGAKRRGKRRYKNTVDDLPSLRT